VIADVKKLDSSEALGSPPDEGSRKIPGYSVPDDELEKRVAHVLVWNALVPANAIRVRADKGSVTLTGHVEFEYQRSAAEAAVRPMCGVFAVTNNITVGRHSPRTK
jgi:osmotically-inducible protein OsmY